MHAALRSASQPIDIYISPYSLQAANHSLLYPDYAWIMFQYASYPKRETDEDQDVCTDEDIILFLNMSRVLIISILPEPEDDSIQTNTGFVSSSLVWGISFLFWKLTIEDLIICSTKKLNPFLISPITLLCEFMLCLMVFFFNTDTQRF